MRLIRECERALSVCFRLDGEYGIHDVRGVGRYRVISRHSPEAGGIDLTKNGAAMARALQKRGTRPLEDTHSESLRRLVAMENVVVDKFLSK